MMMKSAFVVEDTMKWVVTFSVAFLLADAALAVDAGEELRRIGAELTPVLRKHSPEVRISTEAESFTASFHTMVYTVHKNGRGGVYYPQTREATGPTRDGYIIDIRTQPMAPINRASGQTSVMPYWREYFWHGHGDEEEFILFRFKFGYLIPEELREQIMDIVEGPVVEWTVEPVWQPLAGSSSAEVTTLRRIDEGKAKSLLEQHLKSVGEKPQDFFLSLMPFGRSTWSVDCYPERRIPCHPWRYVVDSRGKVEKQTLDSLNTVFFNEYPSLPSADDREKLIKAFIGLHPKDRSTIISTTSDIRGYDKAPLDADIAAAVRAPFSFGKLTTVVYTYQLMGGIVRRYRFSFENATAFSKAEFVVVGRGIGDAQYREQRASTNPPLRP